MDETLPPRRWIDPKSHDSGAKAGKPSGSRPAEPPPPESIGHYRIVERLGQGGMGTVYKCRDEHLNRWVALKVLHERYARDEHYRVRFRREAQTIASLSHASVAEVHGFGETTDVSGTYVYIVMEYLEGQSVEKLLSEKKVLPLEEALRIVLGAASGLREALRRDIIHRDVKPSNILVTSSGGVKIVDFGLAKALGSTTDSLTQEGIVLGTPQYISPEQGRGRTVDHRSDIYSLGAAFYHMVTGRPPFEGNDQVAVIVSHVNDHPAPAHQVQPTLPEAASRVIDRMLAKAPDDRYSSYDDLVSDLEKLQRGEEPKATFVPPPATSTVGHRQRGLSMVAAGAAGALLAVALIAGVAGPRATHGASPLGGWYRPTPDGSGVLDLRFELAARSLEDRNILAELIRVPVSQTEDHRNAEPPRHRGDALEWENFSLPFALQHSFDNIREVQLEVGRTTGTFDLGIAIVDPLGAQRRALHLRLRPSQPSPFPFQALRRGEPVKLEAASDNSPPRIGPGPYNVFFTLEEIGDDTRLDVRITHDAGQNEVYRTTCKIAGTDWSDGILVLATPSPVKPFSVRLRRLLVHADLGDAIQLEDLPWRS